MTRHIHPDSSMPFPGPTHLAGNDPNGYRYGVAYVACGRRAHVENVVSEHPTCLDCRQIAAKQTADAKGEQQ